MKAIIFSDIQGNYEAMSKFAAGTCGFLADKYFCLGDIVNQGVSFQDNRVVSLLRDSFEPLHVIRGNHDENLPDESRDKIIPDNLKYLALLPETLKVGDVMAFHSSIRNKGKRTDRRTFKS